jgi:hypothetical protein
MPPQLNYTCQSLHTSHLHISLPIAWLCADAAVAALSLLPKEDAWLDMQQPLLITHVAQPLLPTAAAYDAAPALPLTVLKCEAAEFRAALALLGRLPGLDIMAMGGLSGEYLFEQLLGAGDAAGALRLAHVLHSSGSGAGGEQHALAACKKLEAVAAALGARCAAAQTRGAEDVSGSGAAATAVANDAAAAAGGGGGTQQQQQRCAYGGPGYLCSGAAASWHELRGMLDTYEDHGAGQLAGRLRAAAVDGILSAAPEIELPRWLLAPFEPPPEPPSSTTAVAAQQQHHHHRHGSTPGTSRCMAGSAADPAALLRVLLRRGRLLDAARLAAVHLAAWQRQGALARCAPAAAWLPLRDLERLHASLSAAAGRAGAAGRSDDAELLGSWAELLESGVASHVALARSDSEKLLATRPTTGGAAAAGGLTLAY